MSRASVATAGEGRARLYAPGANPALFCVFADQGRSLIREMAQWRFWGFVTQDHAIDCHGISREPMKRANRMNDNRSGYVFVTSAEKHGRSPLERSENSTFETESDGSSVDRFGRATLETTDPSLQVYPKALRLICFARLSWSARPEARAGNHRRGISTHARYVRPDVPLDRPVSPLVQRGAGALGLPAEVPAGPAPPDAPFQ